MDRSQEIIRTSWIGIATNVLLAGFKATVGVLSSSVVLVSQLTSEIQPMVPDIQVVIVVDHNYSE